MTRSKAALVWLLGKLRLATPAWRAYEALLARRTATGAGATATTGRDGLPLPPPALMLSVAGTTDAAWFQEGGPRAVEALREILARRGLSLEQKGAILEFGCGCGRVLRHLRGLPGAVHGSDWNARAVAWCRSALPFARFEVNRLAPPLPYADASFDLVYALSVFTHLGEDLQRPWMDELQRVLRPGGHLVLSTHGQRYADELPPRERARFAAGGFLVRRAAGAGTNLCSAFHPEAYLRGEFSRGWELLELVPEGARGNPHQDLTLLRRPL
jgi:SAM-dependent methyltransferase